MGGTIGKRYVPSLADFREYNREQLVDWLAANVGGGLMHEGMGVRRIDKRHKPGAGIPLTGEMLRALEDPDAQLTDEIMRRVVEDLEKERPLWHAILTPVYFAADASPARVEEWRRQASDSVPEQYAALYGHYLAAVEWMLARAEELLERAGRMRLVAPSPYPEDLETVWPKRLRSEARRRTVRDLYYKFLEELGDEGEAYRRAAEAVGYAERTVREKIIKRQVGLKAQKVTHLA
ncbi:MAG: hypothetical protein M3P49_03445 [Actinomycetota bacterium]|nr:hypothetical protein [Actinomycetota bacterium]